MNNKQYATDYELQRPQTMNKKQNDTNYELQRKTTDYEQETKRHKLLTTNKDHIL